jgi:hypothetical protein
VGPRWQGIYCCGTLWPKKAETPQDNKSVYKKSRKTTKREEMGEKNEKWKQSKRNVDRGKRYSLDYRKTPVLFRFYNSSFYTWSPAVSFPSGCKNMQINWSMPFQAQQGMPPSVEPRCGTVPSIKPSQYHLIDRR